MLEFFRLLLTVMLVLLQLLLGIVLFFGGLLSISMIWDENKIAGAVVGFVWLSLVCTLFIWLANI